MLVETRPILHLSDPCFSNEEIKVNNSGLVRLQHIPDEDGNVVVAENGKSLPFRSPRIYFRYGVNPSKTFGRHAHRTTEQIIVNSVEDTSFLLSLYDGQNSQSICMDVPFVGVRLGKHLWHEMSEFSVGSSPLVIANKNYFEPDYIRDEQYFEWYIKLSPMEQRIDDFKAMRLRPWQSKVQDFLRVRQTSSKLPYRFN